MELDVKKRLLKVEEANLSLSKTYLEIVSSNVSLKAQCRDLHSQVTDQEQVIDVLKELVMSKTTHEKVCDTATRSF